MSRKPTLAEQTELRIRMARDWMALLASIGGRPTIDEITPRSRMGRDEITRSVLRALEDDGLVSNVDGGWGMSCAGRIWLLVACDRKRPVASTLHLRSEMDAFSSRRIMRTRLEMVEEGLLKVEQSDAGEVLALGAHAPMGLWRDPMEGEPLWYGA